MSGKVGQVGKVGSSERAVPCRAISISMQFCFQNVFSRQTQLRNAQDSTQEDFFDSAPPPEFYVVHRIDEAGM